MPGIFLFSALRPWVGHAAQHVSFQSGRCFISMHKSHTCMATALTSYDQIKVLRLTHTLSLHIHL